MYQIQIKPLYNFYKLYPYSRPSSDDKLINTLIERFERNITYKSLAYLLSTPYICSLFMDDRYLSVVAYIVQNNKSIEKLINNAYYPGTISISIPKLIQDFLYEDALSV